MNLLLSARKTTVKSLDNIRNTHKGKLAVTLTGGRGGKEKMWEGNGKKEKVARGSNS